MSYKPAPEYCPDDLKEDEVCPVCGATPWYSGKCVCRARHSGPKPKPYIEFIVVKREES